MTLRQISFQAIGTKWDVQLQTPLGDEAWDELLASVRTRIESFDKTYSRFRADSLITAMASQAGRYNLPNDGFKLLDFYHRLYEVTAGKLTPLIGHTMEEAGYDADYSLQKKALHQPPTWEAALTYDQTSVTITQPVLLDFGAAGKGYLVDIVAEIIEAAGIQTYVVNAGGDIRHRSAAGDALKVGLENPLDTSEAIGIAELSNVSLCASAGSKRKWADMTHIIDPTSLSSPDQILATWVMAADTMTADGLATALFFTEPLVLAEQFTFSYCRLGADMQLEATPDFPVTLFDAAP